jgi:hypothetical protein
MTTQVYQLGGAGFTSVPNQPIVAPRDPVDNVDVISPNGGPYQLGQSWRNTLTGNYFQFIGAGNWQLISGPVAGPIDTLTGNSGGAIGPDGAGNINILGSNTTQVTGSGHTLTVTSSASGYPITPFVVGPSGKGGYQTIQSAINAANSAGGGTVWIQPGTYNENLTLYNLVNLIGFPGEEGSIGIFTSSGTNPSVIITGTLTVNTSALGFSSFNTFENLWFAPATGDTVTFLSNQAFNSVISFKGCVLSVTQSTHSLFVCDGFPTINLQDCFVYETVANTCNLLSLPNSQKFSIIQASGTYFAINKTTPCSLQTGCDVHFYLTNCNYGSMIDTSAAAGSFFSLDAIGCTFLWTGSGTQPLVNFGAQEGSVSVNNSLYLGGTGGFASSTAVASNSFFQINNTYFTNTLTLTGQCKDNYAGCIFFTGSSAAITMSSAGNVSFSDCVINSSNSPSITGSGSGILTLTNISFLSNSSIAGTLTLAGGVIRGGNFISQFVVGTAPDAHYQTVQSAITAAAAAGGGTVYVKPGTYTENLTLASNVDIVGTPYQQTTITGVHTPPATGSVLLQNLTLTSATHIFSSAAAGTGTLSIEQCIVNVTNGYIFNVVNWVGSLSIDDSGSLSTNDGVVNNTAGAPVFITSSTVGAGTGQTLTYAGGTFTAENAEILCPSTFGTGATLLLKMGSRVSRTMTFTNNSTATISSTSFETGATAAITQSSSGALSLSSCSITSSNSPAITGAGAGALTLGGVDFLSNSSIAGTLTLAGADILRAGGLQVVPATNTPGASPQIVNARNGQVAFTDTIANGAYGTLTLTDSYIASTSVIIASVSCTTVNSALQIAEITPGSGSTAFRIFNAGSASTAANILVNFWVLN